jgi:hypothetical protein
MSEGIKLYKYFTEQLGNMGKVKRAWFTTFNLDISFFERYILSALQGVSYETIRSPLDYEALSVNLSNDEDNIEEGKLEVKVFYDPRAIVSTGRQKQTAIQLYSIDVRTIKSNENQLNFSNGVFHPKVIVIETFSGEYWLMASSANLTFGGWSKNRESFFFEKITDTSVAREVGLFFDVLVRNNKEFDYNELLYKLNKGKFSGENCNWIFHSSFSKKSFIDKIRNSSSELTIWSPYFADDLSDLIDELRENNFENITIIPAKNESQKIRITEDSYRTCSEKNSVQFKQEKLPLSAIDAFVHGKLWLSPHTLAIGSWNMTRAGINLGNKGNNNIEAGIIYDLSNRDYQKIISNQTLTPLRTPQHFLENELENEKENLLELFDVALDILIDWNNLQLQLISPTYSKLLKHVQEDDFIVLPGFGKQRIKNLEKPFTIRANSSSFLTDRYFELETKEGKIIYKGFIREKGLAQRPATEFKSIDDFLKGWLNENPEIREELHRPAFIIEDEFGDEVSKATHEILNSGHQNDWFTGFQAFESILSRIQKIPAQPVKQKRTDLIKIGRVIPGNLNQLRKHLIILLDYYYNQKENLNKSPIYLWFLIEKANYIFKQFNQAIDLPDENVSTIKNLNFNELFTLEQFEQLGKENIEKWKQFTLQKLKQ